MQHGGEELGVGLDIDRLSLQFPGGFAHQLNSAEDDRGGESLHLRRAVTEALVHAPVLGANDV